MRNDTLANSINRMVLHLLSWFVIASFLARAINGHIAFLYTAELVGALLFVLQLKLWGRNINLGVVLAACFVILIYALSLVVNGFSAGLHFLPLELACLAVAMLWLRVPPIHFVVQLFVAVIFAVFLYSLFILDAHPRDLVYGSGNQVSVVVINLAILFYISCYLNRRSFVLWPAAVAFLLSVASLGAIGIVASGVLAMGVVIKGLVRNGKLVAGLTLSGGLSSILILLYANEVTQWLAITLWGMGVELPTAAYHELDITRYAGNDERFEIWREYVTTLSWSSFIIGRELEESYGGVANLHNAFFLLHARSGILFWPVVSVLLLSLSRLLKRNQVLFYCLLSLVVRAIGDTTMLGANVFDWTLLSLILLSWDKNVGSTPSKKGVRLTRIGGIRLRRDDVVTLSKKPRIWKKSMKCRSRTVDHAESPSFRAFAGIWSASA